MVYLFDLCSFLHIDILPSSLTVSRSAKRYETRGAINEMLHPRYWEWMKGKLSRQSPGNYTSTFRQRSSFHRHCRIRRNSSAQRKVWRVAAWRKIHSHLRPLDAPYIWDPCHDDSGTSTRRLDRMWTRPLYRFRPNPKTLSSICD